MSYTISRFLNCDVCGDAFGIDTATYNTLKSLRRDSKDNGWIYRNGKDYCESCKTIER